MESESGEPQFVWTGDRWMQAPDGQKSHEPQFWSILEFDEQGNVLPLKWQNSFELSVNLPQSATQKLLKSDDDKFSAKVAAAPPPFPWKVDIRKDLLDDTRVRWSTLAGLLNRGAPRVAALVGWDEFETQVKNIYRSLL